MNPMYLKKFRQRTGLKQKDFAKVCNISLQSLKFYETGRRELTLKKFQEIKSSFGYLNRSDESRLRVMIDYLRITFKSVRDLEVFCESCLFINFSEFRFHETKLMNYNRLWKRGDIWIFDYIDKHDTGNYQLTLQLSGQGCRQMELILEQNNLSWHDLLSGLYQRYTEINVTRLDLAIDELYLGQDREEEQFLLSDMISKYYKKELHFESLRTWNYIGGGKLHFDDEADIEENRQGISLYFGSRQSSLYFNFYEKRYELAKQENITVREALEIFEIWNRYELRFSDNKANAAIENYLDGVSITEIARGVVNDKIQVYDGTNDYGAYLADSKWQLMFGGTEAMRFQIKPEPYSIDRTIRWLLNQVSPSLAMIDEYDKITNEEYLKMIIESGEISERGAQLLDNVRVTYGSKGGV